MFSRQSPCARGPSPRPAHSCVGRDGGFAEIRADLALQDDVPRRADPATDNERARTAPDGGAIVLEGDGLVRLPPSGADLSLSRVEVFGEAGHGLGAGGPQFCWRMRAGRPGKAGCLGLGGALWCPVQSTRCRAKGEVFQTAPLVASCMALGPGVEPVAAFGPHSPQRSQPPLLVVSTPGDYAPLQFFTNLATGPPCAARDWCHLPDMSAC